MKAGGALALLGCALLIISARPPINGAYPVCPFHAVTGLYCPGCGSLRATYQLLRGNIAGAFGLNPLLLVMSPVLSYVPLSWVWRMITGRGFPELSPPTWMTWAILVVIIAYWIARNIGCYPLTLFAP